MTDDKPVLWAPRDVATVPDEADSDEMISVARQLSEREQSQLRQAIQGGAFEMGSTYVWTRTMAGLRERLADLGTDFIGEMLDRSDIGPHADIHTVLTDFEAVSLAEKLGMFDSLHAMRLRQALERVHYYTNPPDDAGDVRMPPEEGIATLRTCVETVLGHEDLRIAEGFADLRRSIESESLSVDDPEVKALAAAGTFFKRTVLRTMIGAIRTTEGGKSEIVLANLNQILPLIWSGIGDPDKYTVGRAYAELQADGQSERASGLRAALLKVQGFDYVPETLRSNTFLAAADRVITAHHSFSNFHNEPPPIRALASLGKSIPTPAIARCMTAVLCVKMGNSYGHSWAAQGDADALLRRIAPDRWRYFYDSCLPYDEILLPKFSAAEPRARWIELHAALPNLRAADPNNALPRRLHTASIEGDIQEIQAVARQMNRVVASST